MNKYLNLPFRGKRRIRDAQEKCVFHNLNTFFFIDKFWKRCQNCNCEIVSMFLADIPSIFIMQYCFKVELK